MLRKKRLGCGLAGGAAFAILAGLLPMVPAAALAQAGEVTFNPPTDFPVGLTPSAVAAEDLNGDNRPDLATANFNENTVSVLLNDGSAAFYDRTDFPVNDCPSSVAVGNLNGDGRPDLAVTNYCDDNVSVLFNDGSGGFDNIDNHTWPAGYAPASVAVGDFNSDGNPDLVTANLGDHTLSVLLNDGSGGFANHTVWPVGGGPISVAVGDFNSDGSPDLSVADYTTNRILSVLFNDGSGGFANRVQWLLDIPPWSVTVGDFNTDGNPDLATANTTGQVSSVSVLLNDGSGGFANRTDWPVGPVPQSVAVGDFNTDGNPDLATANNSFAPTQSVSVLLNDGSGGFANPTDFTVGARPLSVAVGDFNGDGRPDLATANSGGNSVSVLLNTTGSNAPPIISVAAGGRCVTGTSGSVNLTVGDAESPAGDLIVTATSSNQALVPDANITVGGSGADRTLSVATVASETGSATVTVQVSDGTNTSTIDVIVIAGHNQSEKIGGTAHPDMIFGKNGDDSIGGRDGNDLLCGGNGNDSLGGNAGNDTMYGANGDDLLSGAAGADYFSGGNGTDTAEDLNAAEGDTQDGSIP